MSDLFRPEAIEHRRHRLYGEVVLSMPLTHWTVTAVIAAAFLLLIFFLVFGSFARKETISGWVRPDRGVVRVQAQDEGVVESVLVVEGQNVEAGAPLMRMRLDSDLAKGESFGRRLGAELEGERQQINEQLIAATSQAGVREQQLRDDIASIDREISQHKQQIAISDQRVALAQKLVDERAPYVAKGLVSRFDAEKLNDSLLSTREGREQLTQQMLTKQQRARALSRELATLPQERQKADATIRERLFALDQRITQAARRTHVVLSAPLAGRVAGVHRVAGETARANTILIDLLPKDSKIEVILFAPSRAVGFVAPGSDVRLRYDAFPYQKFGVSRGKVARVSKSPIDGADLPRTLGADEPVYRIVVVPELDHMLVNGQAHALQSGMTLKADVIIERRSVGEHLFAPLLGAWKRG